MTSNTTLIFTFSLLFALVFTIKQSPCHAARLLLQELPPFPEIPGLPQPELPPFPQIPPFPEFPAFPKPEFPPLPELPILTKQGDSNSAKVDEPKLFVPDIPHEFPKPELPHDLPKPELPPLPELPHDLP